MPAYKDKDRNTWTAKFQHRNWCGETKWITKRGFKTKRDAILFEREFLARKNGSLDMLFSEFVKVYREERKPRIGKTLSEVKKEKIEQIEDEKIKKVTIKNIIKKVKFMI